MRGDPNPSARRIGTGPFSFLFHFTPVQLPGHSSPRLLFSLPLISFSSCGCMKC